MMKPCPTCGQDYEVENCDGCGADLRGKDDALAVAVGLMTRGDATVYFYCASCAPKYLHPAFLGAGPGTDLPVSIDVPETDGTPPSAPNAPVQ
jgi:hypothetical protein